MIILIYKGVDFYNTIKNYKHNVHTYKQIYIIIFTKKTNVYIHLLISL